MNGLCGDGWGDCGVRWRRWNGERWKWERDGKVKKRENDVQKERNKKDWPTHRPPRLCNKKKETFQLCYIYTHTHSCKHHIYIHIQTIPRLVHQTMNTTLFPLNLSDSLSPTLCLLTRSANPSVLPRFPSVCPFFSFELRYKKTKIMQILDFWEERKETNARKSCVSRLCLVLCVVLWCRSLALFLLASHIGVSIFAARLWFILSSVIARMYDQA